MTSYVQTTIHSKIAKQQKTNSQNIGTLLKGRIPATVIPKQKHLQLQIAKQIQILPKTKTNINRKMRNKIIPGTTKGQEIVLMQSGIFPAIYFKKTTMRNILKQFVFPEEVTALPPTDQRTPLIYQITSNLFIGQNNITKAFYVFFSDSDTIPYTKCCNAPVYLELQSNGSGKLLCNSINCVHSSIAQFLINFQDGRKLWSQVTYFSQASQKDKQLRHKISKVITTGKYKRKNLVSIVQDTSKQIVDLYFQYKSNNTVNKFAQPQQQQQTPFITAANKLASYEQNQQGLTQDKIHQILTQEDNNIDTLKMKIGYMYRRDKQLGKGATKSIVSEGKVFQKNFEMIKKLDQFMLTQKSSKNTTKLNFPRIMDQLRKTKNKESAKQKRSLSAYNSFT